MSTIRCQDCRWSRTQGDGPCGHWLRHTFQTGEPMPCGGVWYLPPAGTDAYRAHQNRLHVNRQRRYRERLRQAGDKIVSLQLTGADADLLATLSRQRGMRPRELVTRLLSAERLRERPRF